MAEKYQAVIAIPPGETLAEMLEDREMSQKDLANRTGLTPKHINEIIQAKAPITVDTALKFEAVLGTPASFWTNLEANYQETLARLSVEAALESEIPLLGQIPYAELAKLGLVKVTRNNRERVLSAREFFLSRRLKDCRKLFRPRSAQLPRMKRLRSPWRHGFAVVSGQHRQCLCLLFKKTN